MYAAGQLLEVGKAAQPRQYLVILPCVDQRVAVSGLSPFFRAGRAVASDSTERRNEMRVVQFSRKSALPTPKAEFACLVDFIETKNR